jgi:chromosome partitioning protein
MVAIVVAAHKGGSGKTTVVVNVAGCLADNSRRTLAIDCDPQGNLGMGLGIGKARPGLYEVLTGEADVKEAVRPSAVAGLDVLTCDRRLAGAPVELVARRPRDWQLALREASSDLMGSYDVALLDTPPGLGPLPLMAMVAADAVLVVGPPKYFGTEAVEEVTLTIEQARQANPRLRFLGVAPTLVSGRRPVYQGEFLEVLAERYPGHLLPATPELASVEYAHIAGRPISHYAPRSSAALAFGALAHEVWNRAQAA